MGSSQAQAPGVCGKIGVAGTATLGRLKDMWPEAHQAPNLSSLRSPAATYDGRTLILMTWSQECDASLRFVEVNSCENFYFGVRGFAVKIGEWNRCPQNWIGCQQIKTSLTFESVRTLANNNSLLMASPPPPFLQIIKTRSVAIQAWFPVKFFHSGKKTLGYWPCGSLCFPLLW